MSATECQTKIGLTKRFNGPWLPALCLQRKQANRRFPPKTAEPPGPLSVDVRQPDAQATLTSPMSQEPKTTERAAIAGADPNGNAIPRRRLERSRPSGTAGGTRAALSQRTSGRDLEKAETDRIDRGNTRRLTTHFSGPWLPAVFLQRKQENRRFLPKTAEPLRSAECER